MNLAKLRKKAGLTQDDLGHALGFMNGQLVSNIERGICRLPIRHWKKAAKLLKVKTEVFLEAEQAHTKRKLEKALGVKK